jgi:RNA polymerase sigma factor (sigma-70 family)
MRDDPVVIALVRRAAAGDQAAWNEIVDRYAQLVWSICVRFGLSTEDIDDVSQSVWLLLIESIGNLREPAALPGWLAKTTRNECLRVLRVTHRHAHAGLPSEDQMPMDPDAVVIDDEILRAERDAALRTAFAELPPRCRELLSMLMRDPPCRYEDISAKLGIPMGTIGPVRGRCLDRIRRSPHIGLFSGGGTG